MTSRKNSVENGIAQQSPKQVAFQDNTNGTDSVDSKQKAFRQTFIKSKKSYFDNSSDQVKRFLIKNGNRQIRMNSPKQIKKVDGSSLHEYGSVMGSAMLGSNQY